MSQDISHVLQGWDFDPHELNVRVITRDDGSQKLQVRIDLGLLQMEIDGRPDGQRPFGYDSLLDYFEEQSDEFGDGYQLSSDATDDLFREGWQYYHRYLCLFHLGMYEAVVRDTDRILRLFDFVRRYAKKKREKWRFDKDRPYVIMMNVRAKAMMALEKDETPHALREIEAGLAQIEAFLNEYGRPIEDSNCFELEFLRRWRKELRSNAPIDADPVEADRVTKLRVDLEKAIDRENYEYAALLRDQIKRLEQSECDNGE